jgi:LPXTG-motif cell wall-anchored protein
MDGNTMTVTQSSEVAVINVTSLNIEADETLEIITSSSTSLTVFRVTGGGTAVIEGQITSTGSLAVMNAGSEAINVTGIHAFIDVVGDLLLVAGNAPDAQFTSPISEFTVAVPGGLLSVQDGATVHADRAVAIVGAHLSIGGDISADNGDLAIWSAASFTYDRLISEFSVTGTELDSSDVTIEPGSFQFATHGIVRIYSAGSIVHNGTSVGHNAGSTDGISGVDLRGDIQSDALDVWAYGDAADGTPYIGAFPFLGDPVAMTASAVGVNTSGGTYPTRSTFVMADLVLGLFDVAIIQSACGLEGSPLDVHWAMSNPNYNGSEIVPDVSIYSVPNQPPVVVPGLGTVYFNEQEVSELTDWQIVSATAIRIVTESGEIRVGNTSCAIPAEDVLPATGADAAPALAAALLALLALLVGAGFVLLRRRVA